MKKWLVILFFCGAARADAPFEKGAISDNRFLFILNTSYGMRRCRAAAERCLVELVRGGMQGRMQAGDTFGIWTFNNQLHAGDFPMQIWTPTLNTTLARQVQEFLAKQSYDNKTHFETIARPLAAVARSSKSLLVFLVTDGATPVKGTAFDDALNETIKANHKALKARHLPFVIIFGVEDGQYIDIKINSTLNLKLPEVARVELKTAPPPRAPSTNALSTIKEPVSAVAPVANPLFIAPQAESTEVAQAPRLDPQPVQPVVNNVAPPVASQPEKQTSPPSPAPPPSSPPPVSTPAISASAPGPTPGEPPPSLKLSASNAPMAQSRVPLQTNSAESPVIQTPPQMAVPETTSKAGATNHPGNKTAGARTLAQTVGSPGGPENTTLLFWAATAFVFAAIALAWIIFRGPKTSRQPSLISKSIEKTKRDG